MEAWDNLPPQPQNEGKAKGRGRGRGNGGGRGGRGGGPPPPPPGSGGAGGGAPPPGGGGANGGSGGPPGDPRQPPPADGDDNDDGGGGRYPQRDRRPPDRLHYAQWAPLPQYDTDQDEPWRVRLNDTRIDRGPVPLRRWGKPKNSGKQRKPYDYPSKTLVDDDLSPKEAAQLFLGYQAAGLADAAARAQQQQQQATSSSSSSAAAGAPHPGDPPSKQGYQFQVDDDDIDIDDESIPQTAQTGPDAWEQGRATYEQAHPPQQQLPDQWVLDHYEAERQRQLQIAQEAHVARQVRAMQQQQNNQATHNVGMLTPGSDEWWADFSRREKEYMDEIGGAGGAGRRNRPLSDRARALWAQFMAEYRHLRNNGGRELMSSTEAMGDDGRLNWFKQYYFKLGSMRHYSAFDEDVESDRGKTVSTDPEVDLRPGTNTTPPFERDPASSFGSRRPLYAQQQLQQQQWFANAQAMTMPQFGATQAGGPPPNPQPQPGAGGGGGGGGPPPNPQPQPPQQPLPTQPLHPQQMQQPTTTGGNVQGGSSTPTQGIIAGSTWEVHNTVQRNIIDPGRARVDVFRKIRDNAVRGGLFRPCNTWRQREVSFFD